MDQMKDSIADQHRRRRYLPTKFRCFLGCFGGGTSEEHDEKPQRKLKSKSHNRWFSWLKSKSVKSPKKTVPVESASDINVNHEKGSTLRSNSKSNKMISSCDELPAKGDEEIQSQPPVSGGVLPGKALPAKGDEEIQSQPAVAGGVLPGKANKTTRSGNGIYLMRNSKSMNHLVQLQDMKDSSSSTFKKGALRKSKSAKISNNSPTVELSQSAVTTDPILASEITGGGVDNKVVKKREDEKKGGGGRFDRVVGISIIVMVLLIMAIWGKLFAILCSSAWLYFYPLLLKSNYIFNNKSQHVGQTNNSNSIDEKLNTNTNNNNNNSHLLKKKVVFQGLLQRDHQIT